MLPSFDSVLYVSLFVIFSTLLRYYWKYAVQLRDFPSMHFKWDLTLGILTGRFSGHSGYSNFFLTDFQKIFKQHSEEGVACIWIGRPVLLVFNPEHSKVLLNASNDKPANFSVVAEALGEGVSSLSGLKWKRRRKLLNPAFRTEVLNCKMPTLNCVAKRFEKKLSDVADGNVVDIRDLVRHTTFCAVLETFFGVKTDNEKYFRLFSGVNQILLSLDAYTASRFLCPWLQGKYSQLLFKEGRKHWKMFQIAKNYAKEILKDCINSSSSDVPESDRSFISTLLDMHLKDPSFQEADIIEEVKTFITAGYDPVSNAMMWCLFTLASHSEIQERAFEEVQSVLGNDVSDITHEDLNQLIYLECVIKETLRLYPSIPTFARKTSKEVQCGKYKIPKGIDVYFFPFFHQRDPNFYPDPETFDPERFMGKNDQLTLIAFGGGARGCIGKQFAMMEMKVLLAYVLRNFRITVMDRKEDVKLKFSILLNPATPLRFKLYRRK